jgi:hypothetical protein
MVDDDDECVAVGGIKISRGNESTRRKPVPMPLSLPQIPHDLSQARTRAAAVGTRRLTAWDMARPIRMTNVGVGAAVLLARLLMTPQRHVYFWKDCSRSAQECRAGNEGTILVFPWYVTLIPPQRSYFVDKLDALTAVEENTRRRCLDTFAPVCPQYASCSVGCYILVPTTQTGCVSGIVSKYFASLLQGGVWTDSVARIDNLSVKIIVNSCVLFSKNLTENFFFFTVYKLNTTWWLSSSGRW